MAALIHDAETVPTTLKWQKAVEKASRSVVSIKFCHTHSFDTDEACCSEATGFVVDTNEGYILTNRHVVGTGPFLGYCVFVDNEEVLPLFPHSLRS
jgi:S1-C subfamily serine protease